MCNKFNNSYQLTYHAFIIVVRFWTPNEKIAVSSSLGKFIRLRRAPRKEDCERAIEEHPVALANRSWKAIKTYVHNMNNKKVKKLCDD